MVYHTVSFDTDGGTFVLPQQVQDGKTAVEPKSPQKEGCTFSAWYNGKDVFDFSSPVTEDIVLKAYWEEIWHNVAFDSNGGTYVPDQTVECGMTATVPEEPQKDDCTFGGWYIDINGETFLFDFSTPITDSIILKAWWYVIENTPVTVQFNPNGGIICTTIQEFPVGQETALYSASYLGLSRDGYNFIGWSLSENGEKIYDDAGAITITDSITLYALWEPVEPQTPSDNQTSKLFMGFDKVVNIPAESTLEEITNAIYNLTEATTLKMNGAINGVKISTIVSAMKVNSTVPIALDLSETTSVYEWKDWFVGVETLYAISLPCTVTTVQQSAFENCTNLKAITLPCSIETALSLFRESYSDDGIDYTDTSINFLGSIEDWLNIPGKIFDSIDLSDIYLNGVNIKEITEVVIPDSITTIRDYAFGGFTGLTSIAIPSSVTNIGSRAFDDCTALTTVNYRGTEEQWNAITIGSGNSCLTGATINYNYTGE